MSESLEQAVEREIVQDRRAERRLVPKALIALLVVTAFVVMRELFLR